MQRYHFSSYPFKFGSQRVGRKKVMLQVLCDINDQFKT